MEIGEDLRPRVRFQSSKSGNPWPAFLHVMCAAKIRYRADSGTVASIFSSVPACSSLQPWHDPVCASASTFRIVHYCFPRRDQNERGAIFNEDRRLFRVGMPIFSHALPACTLVLSFLACRCPKTAVAQPVMDPVKFLALLPPPVVFIPDFSCAG